MTKGRESARGFALVLVLSLLAILVLLTYTISSVSKVDGEISAAAIYQTQARQNAIFGLKLALGKLQKYAGPDSSITATADIVNGARLQNSRWTGVWLSGATVPAWLVSGNADPTSYAPSFSFGDDREIIVPSTSDILLVGGGSTNTLASRYNDGDAVLVPKVAVELQSAQGLLGKAGSFAYWVGDEGVKLSAQLPGLNPPAAPAVSIHNIPELPYSWTPSMSDLPKAVSYEQLDETGAGPSTLKNTFHGLTLLHVGYNSPTTRSAGLVNVNSAGTRLWQGVIGTVDPSLSSNKKKTFAKAISDIWSLGSVVGPFLTVDEFVNSVGVQDALDSLSEVTTTEFRDAMEPWFTVRSDTFRIRAYGDAMNPADAGDSSAIPESVAYCEAIVQRTPEVIDSANGPLGRKFVITYFRWLGLDDI